jgi:hypothetical protein
MILKHRDRELLRFEWIDPQGVRVLSVNEAERRFLPLEMKGESTDEALWKWLTHRTVPKHRHYIQMMLDNLGITRMSTQAIIEMCSGNGVYGWIPRRVQSRKGYHILSRIHDEWDARQMLATYPLTYSVKSRTSCRSECLK